MRLRFGLRGDRFWPEDDFGWFVSGRKNPVSSMQIGFSWRLVRMWWLPHGKTKHLVLTGPFRGQVGETGNSHTVREPSINGRLDEVGREEGE